MSKDAYMSCASCHLDGGSDERVWDFTQRGEGMRNTITLLGRAGTYQGPVHWTGNFDEIHDFENDIRGQFEGTGLMTDAQYNAGTRSTALGDRKIGISPDLDQLSIYVSMLNKVPNSPYRNSDGSLTSDAVAGKALFNSPTVGCVSCHSGSQFTDSTLTTPYNRHNVGTITTASGNRNNSTLDGFDTPSLLGVWATAPYLHDGSAATLLDVITTKNSGNNHGTTSQLSSTQKQQLVAYLQQLDQSDYPTITLGTISPTSLSVTAGGSASVTVNVTASDTNTGGSISSVECFRDQTSIGSDTSSPYSVAWTPGSNTAGTYLLQCVATDNDGNKTASEARLLNVGPTAVSITNLSAKDTTNAGDYSVRSNIQIGDTVFGDRTFTFTSLPNSIAGSAWIRTANDSKSATNSPLLTFDIDRQADVYIALDDRLTKPSWLDATWMDTGEELKVREDATNTRTASLYKKNFKSGQVSLGPNGGSNMYVVIVKSTPTTISNLSAKDTTNAADYSIRSNIQNGDIALGDRSFTLDAVPTSIAGSAWIRTANDSKAATNNPLLTFDIHRQANVYIALDDRLTKPSWLDSSWVDTGEELQVKESASVIRTASLYRKNFAAGQVSLGPNGSTNSNMYIVIVR
jgi:mono/diheme cytochrome c family protein